MIRPQPKPVKRVKAKKPLARSKPMRNKPPRRLSRPQSDPARLAWVRTLRCAVITGGCFGTTEACHEGKKPGVGMKCDDAEAMPMCWKHHLQWTAHQGIFYGWTKAERRRWADGRIADTKAMERAV